MKAIKRLEFAAIGLLIAGCASQPRTASQPKPGSGIAEYREITREAHKAVADTVTSLEALARPNLKSSVHPALAGFDRAMHQLELTSVKTRARAEAIIARGQAYFDEWTQQMNIVTNQAAAQADAERYARLYAHFERIREKSGEVRTEFRPFMAELREFRATLDRPPDLSGKPPSVGNFGGLTQRGRRVLGALEAVSRALDDAEIELRGGLAAKR